jgi:transcription initiation factor IIE alpha subunit
MGIIKFIEEQLEKSDDIQVKGLEYIVRVFNSLPKGIIMKTGSGILDALRNKLNKEMPEMHFPGYNYCGPFTRRDERLARNDAPLNKLDA